MSVRDPKHVTQSSEGLAARLREARELAGLSQGQVAKLLEVHRPTISEIEAGRRRVQAEELAAFADLYHVSVPWLLGAPEPAPDHLEWFYRRVSALAGLEARAAEARELVAKLEWGQDDECPLCLRWRFAKSPLGHNPDCPIRKFLSCREVAAAVDELIDAARVVATDCECPLRHGCPHQRLLAALEEFGDHD